MTRFWIIGALVLAAGGCATSPQDSPAAGASADLRDAAGTIVGHASATSEAGGVRLRVSASGMTPGLHGIHVHAVGRCDPPGFASAGPHWNPESRQHGRQNPLGMHKGDLPNLAVGADGRGRLDALIAGAALTGAGALLDADGAAVVVHAMPDDERTDPSGNSGARIACGVLG
jgi:Cu-Zn family superoxide dismutase